MTDLTILARLSKEDLERYRRVGARHKLLQWSSYLFHDVETAVEAQLDYWELMEEFRIVYSLGDLGEDQIKVDPVTGHVTEYLDLAESLKQERLEKERLEKEKNADERKEKHE